MTPCYYTGKVWIGSNYFPDTRPRIEGHAAQLQTVLLGKYKPQHWIIRFIWRLL